MCIGESPTTTVTEASWPKSSRIPYATKVSWINMEAIPPRAEREPGRHLFSVGPVVSLCDVLSYRAAMISGFFLFEKGICGWHHVTQLIGAISEHWPRWWKRGARHQPRLNVGQQSYRAATFIPLRDRRRQELVMGDYFGGNVLNIGTSDPSVLNGRCREGKKWPCCSRAQR